MKSLLTTILLGAFTCCSAQTNYTGRYGYQESYGSLKERMPTVGRGETGYSQKLFLIRINGTRYKFWLYVVKGYPSYNSGEISGSINIESNKALFTCTDSAVVETSCQLDFQFLKKRVVVKQGIQDCGFGHGVGASGNYPKVSSSLTTKDLANFGQQTTDKFSVNSTKAYLFEDEKGLKGKGQYFLRNDIVYAFDETTILR